MSKIAVVLSAAILVLSTVGCSSNGEISNITPNSVKSALPTVHGLISGSLQNYKTTGGYVVSASVGSWFGGKIAQTSGGYQVFSTVQGTIASEAVVTTVIEE